MYDTFWFGFDIQDFLVYGFQVDSALGLLAICITVAVFVIIYEGVKVYQEMNSARFNIKKLFRRRSIEHSTLINRRSTTTTSSHLSSSIRQGSLYGLQITMGYIVMLIVMTFNVYVFVSVVVGAAIGYFLFGSLIMEINLDNILNSSCGSCTLNSGERSSNRLYKAANDLIRIIDDVFDVEDGRDTPVIEPVVGETNRSTENNDSADSIQSSVTVEIHSH